MADGKNKIIIYRDWIHTIEKLDNENAGLLIKHLMRYVNDKNPEPPNMIVEIAFEQMKQTLKRDLKKWEVIAERNRENGKKGGRKPRKPKKPTGLNGNPKKGVSVSDSVSVSEYTNVYSKSDFFKDWNELRLKHLKKPSNLNRMGIYAEDNFKTIVQAYTPEQIRNAMIGLFRQKKLPGDNSVMQSNPDHFLNKFESYLTAYDDMNDKLYGKTEVA